MGEFRKSNASRAGHKSRVNSQDNLIFNQPTSPVTLNPTRPSGRARRQVGQGGKREKDKVRARWHFIFQIVLCFDWVWIKWERETWKRDKEKMRWGTFAGWQRQRDDRVQQTETDRSKKNGRQWITALESSSSYRLKLSGWAVSGKVKERDKHIMMLNDDMMMTGGTGSRDIDSVRSKIHS